MGTEMIYILWWRLVTQDEIKIEFIKPHVTTLAAGKLLRFKTHLHSLSCNFYISLVLFMEEMSHTDFLNDLAAVCEAAERISVPRYHPPPPSCAGYTESGITTTAVEAMGGPPYDQHYLHPSECPPHASEYYSPPVPIATLSCYPPSSSSSCSSPSPAAFAELLQNGRVFQKLAGL